MPVASSFSIDLRQQQILDFLKDLPSQGSKLTVSVAPAIAAQGKTEIERRSEPGHVFDDVAVTAIRQTYFVFQGGSLLGKYIITMPVNHLVSVSLRSVLAVDNALAGLRITQDIIEAFRRYNFISDGDPSIYASSKATALGVDLDSFEIFLEPTITLVRTDIDRSKENWLERVFNGDAHSLVDYIEIEENLSSMGYTIVKDGVETLSEYSNPPYSAIEVAPGTSDSAILDLVEKKTKSDAATKECVADQIVIKRIGAILWWPETKVEWGWKRVKVGRCKFDVYWPTTYKREGRNILFSKTSFTEGDKRFRRIISDCMEEAAIIAGVLAIAVDSIELAVASFEPLVTACVVRKTGEILDCMLPDLYVVKETSAWTKV